MVKYQVIGMKNGKEYKSIKYPNRERALKKVYALIYTPSGRRVTDKNRFYSLRIIKVR